MSHFVIARIQIEGLTLTPNQRFSLRRLALSERGASRSSRTLGAGCGGRFGVARRTMLIADGKAVWSWRPDAGVKLAERSASDGGKKARSPRRARN